MPRVKRQPINLQNMRPVSHSRAMEAVWGCAPFLKVPQGQENSLHAVALDLGQFKLKTREGGYEGEAGPVQTMNVVMAEGAGNINRPAYEDLRGREATRPRKRKPHLDSGQRARRIRLTRQFLWMASRS